MKKAFVKTLTEIWLPNIEIMNQEICQVLCFPDACSIPIQGYCYTDKGTQLELAHELTLGKKYELKVMEEVYPISFRLFTATDIFETTIHAREEALGVRCFGNRTYFSIWAPTAYQIDLLFLHQGMIEERWAMERTANGVWKRIFDSNLHGMSYLYEISVDGETYRVVDPYTLGATVNAAEGMVVDIERVTEVPKISLPLLQANQRIIYEMHIRDYTISKTSTVIRKGKYAGFTDEDPLDYLQSLGITYVQLMPLQKFYGIDERNPESAYNWGYNPLLYFVPEGSYSSNPGNPLERILEVKELVYRLHRKKIRVILDVVYNHVYHIETHALDRIVPGYYIRTHADGRYVDSCGCGNDLATERSMVRKLIIESLIYWLEMFDVDGFRFDLMGNMDIPTMQEIQSTLTSKKKDIFLLGEGWNLDTTLSYDKKAITDHAKRLPDYAFFHDVFRDGVKGSIFDVYECGFGTGKKNQGEKALQLFSGNYIASSPLATLQQSINYIECHDNHTLFDKIACCCSDESSYKRKNRHMLMSAFTILAQGTPFLQCGQEFFRSKKGEANTYNLCDEYNEINWRLLQDNQESIDWFRSLIRLRCAHGVFGLRGQQDVEAYGRLHALWADGFAYHWHNIGHLGAKKELLIVFHFGEDEQELDLSKWQGAAVYLQLNADELSDSQFVSCGKVKLTPISCFVLAKK